MSCTWSHRSNLNQLKGQAPKDLSNIAFTFVGRFLHNKGISEFVDASIRASKVLDNASFNIAGCPDEGIDSISISTIRRWKNETPVNFLGYLNTKQLLESISVLVLPSYREGYSRIIQEAMASSIPVIATNVPGCKQSIIHRYNGLLVPPYNVTDLASAMIYLGQNPPLINEMSLMPGNLPC